MSSMQSKKRNKKPIRSRSSDIPTKFNTKLFISLGLLLVVLLMKKYDLSIGNFDVDSLYQVVYYNEDLNSLKEKVFFLKEKPEATEDTMQNTLQKEDTQENSNDNDENIEPSTSNEVIDEEPIDNPEVINPEILENLSDENLEDTQ